jgi:hypothetical protein
MSEQDDVTPAESRVRELLAPLGATTPATSTALVPRIVRTARWQRAVREALLDAGAVVSAVGGGLRALIGVRRSGS